jgi:outer membrane lipoprotein-sorting protein
VIQDKGKKMRKITATCVSRLCIITCFYLAGTTQAAESKSSDAPCPSSELVEVLDRLKGTVQSLQDYQGQIEYLFEQPLLESKMLRKGKVSYTRTKKNSCLRVDFETLKQDDQKQQAYREYFVFDGVWLTHIDYQVKSIQKRQMAEEGKPVDAFDLARGNMPIIGFSATEDLRKEFDIELNQAAVASNHGTIQLHLTVKPGSAYEEDYKTIDFWVDKKLNLPVRVDALTTEDDIYRIRFIKAKVNQGIADSVFAVELPPGFGPPEIIPLDPNH